MRRPVRRTSNFALRIDCFVTSLVLMLPLVLLPAAAAQTASLPALRYHFGDNPAWSSPAFDDSSWPIADRGQVPVPPFYSDGYVWVRARVPIRAGAEAPLAILLTGNEGQPMAGEVYVNGTLVGRQGALDPNPTVAPYAEPAVFEIPAGVAAPGATALVCLRSWFIPSSRVTTAATVHFESSHLSAPRFTIDSSRFLVLDRRAGHQRALLSIGPQLGTNLIITCLGLALLFLWRRSGGSDILLCAAFLLLYAPFGIAIELESNGVLRIPVALFISVYFLVQIAQMECNLEFTWTIHGFRNRFSKRLGTAVLVVFNLADLYGWLAPHPSRLLAFSMHVWPACVSAFDAISFGANLWALVVNRRNQLIAASLALIPATATLDRLGFPDRFNIGLFSFDTFNFAFLLSAVALFMMLGKRAWTAWSQANSLRVEFDAAREVQERLVTAPPQLPGFHVEAAYIPAAQVGGDFYYVRPEEGGGLLVVVGDVSGKGLPAAMAVAAIVGALRAMPKLAPSRVLSDLNRSLTGDLGGGFVTAICARIMENGTVTVANAGHLAPYCNGDEIKLEPGLPLGLTADAAYGERTLTLPSGETLTFLSDGVLEARNASGELFGFERTAAISTQAADAIAGAAQHFGQEDDITVLTMAFAGAELTRA